MAAKDGAKRSHAPTIDNRRARHDYFIDDSFEAGIELMGSEVKALRQGNANLRDAYCQVQNGELWVLNLYIKPYEQANRWAADERRPRKLLIHKGEALRLDQRVREKSLTLIPLKLYFTRGWAKLEVGIARGKRQYDKREAIRERDIERAARRGEE